MDAKLILGAKKIGQMCKALREAGYTTITEDEVATQATKAMAGEQVDVGPGMMIRDALKREGWIK